MHTLHQLPDPANVQYGLPMRLTPPRGIVGAACYDAEQFRAAFGDKPMHDLLFSIEALNSDNSISFIMAARGTSRDNVIRSARLMLDNDPTIEQISVYARPDLDDNSESVRIYRETKWR